MPLHFQANTKKLPKVTQANKGSQRLCRENITVMELEEDGQAAAQTLCLCSQGWVFRVENHSWFIRKVALGFLQHIPVMSLHVVLEGIRIANCGAFIRV